MNKLNGIAPPVGTLLPGLEPMVVYVSFKGKKTAWLRIATNDDYLAVNNRKPAEVHSVYEHRLIPPRWTIFGIVKVIG